MLEPLGVTAQGHREGEAWTLCPGRGWLHQALSTMAGTLIPLTPSSELLPMDKHDVSTLASDEAST